MLKSRYTSLLSLVLLFICSTTPFAQKKPDIKGNRVVAVVDKALEPFHSIVVEEDLDLSFKKGTEPIVHFVADDNLPPVFKFEVKDSVLHIGSYYRIKSKKELQIQINYTTLKSIKLNGGQIKIDINSNDADLEIEAFDKTALEVFGIASKLGARLEANASLKLTATLEDFKMEASDRSSAALSGVFKSVSINLNDRSSLTALGSCEELFIEQGNNSLFKGSGFKTTTAVLHMTETAVADIYVLDKVQMSMDHQSTLNFYGTATLDVKSFLGTAKIFKKAFETTPTISLKDLPLR